MISSSKKRYRMIMHIEPPYPKDYCTPYEDPYQGPYPIEHFISETDLYPQSIKERIHEIITNSIRSLAWLFSKALNKHSPLSSMYIPAKPRKVIKLSGMIERSLINETINQTVIGKPTLQRRKHPPMYLGYDSRSGSAHRLQDLRNKK